MLIGTGFNDEHKKLLKNIADMSEGDPSKSVSVKEANKDLNLSRKDIKLKIEFLEALGLITINTIGGSLLYGHVSITEKGLKRVENIT